MYFANVRSTLHCLGNSIFLHCKFKRFVLGLKTRLFPQILDLVAGKKNGEGEGREVPSLPLHPSRRLPCTIVKCSTPLGCNMTVLIRANIA